MNLWGTEMVDVLVFNFGSLIGQYKFGFGFSFRIETTKKFGQLWTIVKSEFFFVITWDRGQTISISRKSIYTLEYFGDERNNKR